MLNRMHRAEDWIAGALVLVIVGAISLQVFCRYVLNAPLPWPEEVAKLAFVWAIFMGATIGVQRRGHVTVDALIDRFPLKAKLATRVVVYVAVIAILAVLTAKGIDMVRMASTSLLPAIGIKTSYLYLPLPVCGALMIVDYLALLNHAVTCFRKGVPEEVGEGQMVG